MIKDIQTVSNSYNFTNDIIIYEKLNMFYFKVIVNSLSCTILSHNHKIISESDIIINSIWKDVKDFVDINIVSKQKIISDLYGNVIIGFLYCPVEKPLKIDYSTFYNIKNDNNKFIINSVKDLNKNDINITDFCKSINLLNIRGIGGGPIITYSNNVIEILNNYTHKNITLDEFIKLSKTEIKTYSGNEIEAIEGLIIKTNKDLYQIILNSTDDTKIYDRSEFEYLIKDFIDIWPKIKNELTEFNNYNTIISDIFLKYINTSNIITKISNYKNLNPPGHHYIGDICYELLNNNSIKTICKINETYKNIFRILFKGLKHYKKNSKYNNLSNDYIDKWNNIVDYIIQKIKRD